jgi:ATP-binding cassette subfamily B (MDR/TAP) protein 1
MVDTETAGDTSSDDKATDSKKKVRKYNKSTGKWEVVDDSIESDEAAGADDKKKKETKTVPFTKLFHFSDCDGYLIVIGAIGAIGVGGALPLFALLFGDLINGINNPNVTEAAQEIEIVSLYFLYVGIGMFCGGFLRVFSLSAAAKRQTHRFRISYVKEMLRQDMGWHDSIKGSEFTSKIAEAATKFEAAISSKFGEVLTYTSSFIVGIIIGLIKDWVLTLVILSLLPVAGVLGALFGQVMSSAAKDATESYAAAGGVAEETIASIRTITSLNAQGSAFSMYSSYLEAARKAGVKASLNGAALFAGFNLFMFCAYGLTFWYGAKRVINGDVEGGDVLTIFFCVLFGAIMLGQSGPSMKAIQEGQAVLYEAFEVIDRKPEIDIDSNEGKEVTDIKGHIELRNVKFSYPSRSETSVLQGVSFEIKPGTSVALVGSSGCGKSTCMALIQRFYDPTEGEIYLDGVNLRDLQVRSLRSHIGIVSQEPVLFATSIMDNIKYGAGADKIPSDEDVHEACRAANIHDFISSLPDGYGTDVGDQGIQLSGGQKQRVAIARSLLRNPTILLLDEATSALDTQSERVVQEALDSLMAERTTIMIAHRLSTVRKATNIIVMDEGSIIEQGTHNELVGIDGVYAELARLQEIHEKKNVQLDVVGEAKKVVKNINAEEEECSEIVESSTQAHGEDKKKKKMTRHKKKKMKPNRCKSGILVL